MIAVDTNILVYAHREDSPWHGAAYGCVSLLTQPLGEWKSDSVVMDLVTPLTAPPAQPTMTVTR